MVIERIILNVKPYRKITSDLDVPRIFTDYTVQVNEKINGEITVFVEHPANAICQVLAAIYGNSMAYINIEADEVETES